MTTIQDTEIPNNATAIIGTYDGDPFTLDMLAEQGMVVEDWKRWQQGDCGIYAAALIRAYPHLRLGSLTAREWDEDDECEYDNAWHFFAHDDTHAYDSAGVHPLPYYGLSPVPTGVMLMCITDEDPVDYGMETPVTDDWIGDGKCAEAYRADMADALAHARKHGLVPRV